MAAEPWVFKTVLVGRESLSEHIARITRDPLFCTRVRQHDPPHLEVVGPLKEALTGTFEEIFAQCQERAKELGVKENRLVESTAFMIAYADIAERQVLAAPLTIILSSSDGIARGNLKLSVDDRGPKDSRNCIPDYVRWRIGCVAQAMGMEISSEA